MYLYIIYIYTHMCCLLPGHRKMNRCGIQICSKHRVRTSIKNVTGHLDGLRAVRVNMRAAPTCRLLQHPAGEASSPKPTQPLCSRLSQPLKGS